MFTYQILNTEEIITHSPAVIEEGVEISPAVDFKTHKVKVLYTFDNQVNKEIIVSVFQPKNSQEIEKSIYNRGVAEEKKLNS